MELRIFQTVERVETLGPYKRFGLWVQGCKKNCPGCVSQEGHSFEGGYGKEVEELAEEILGTADIEGITISGGEPFLQTDALCRLLEYIKKRRDFGVIVYTGYKFEEICDNELIPLCDALIDGEYIEKLDDGMSLRGSSNQHLIFTTDRYREKFYIGGFKRKTEILMTKEGGVSLVGVPSRHSLNFAVYLKKFLHDGGEKMG